MLKRPKFAWLITAANTAVTRMPSFEGKSMKKNLVAMLGSAAAAFVIVTGVSSTPAEARTQCIFFATNGGTWSVVTQGTARRSSTACRRAKRRCNRKLDRAKRRGQIPRGSQTPRCRKHSGRWVGF